MPHTGSSRFALTMPRIRRRAWDLRRTDKTPVADANDIGEGATGIDTNFHAGICHCIHV